MRLSGVDRAGDARAAVGSGGERVRGGSSNAMVVGAVMVALGVVLTAVSWASAAETGGVFFIFPGFIIGGLVMFFRGAATSTVRGYRSGRVRARNPRRTVYGTHARPAQVPPEDYVAPPGAMPAGYCWACGAKVRKDNAICYACGAARVVAPSPSRHSADEPPQLPQPYPPSFGAPYPGNPYPGNPYPGNPYPGNPYPGSPYPGNPYPNGPYPGGPYAGETYSGEPYPGSGSSQPNPPRW